MSTVATFKHELTATVKPTAAVTRCRFTNKNGDLITTTGARSFGVSLDTLTSTDITNAETVAVCIIGIVELELGGTVTPTDKLTSDTVGRGIAASANQAINAYPLITANAASGDRIRALLVSGAAASAPFVIAIPVSLASVTGAGDVLTNWTPGFAGTILSYSSAVKVPVTTGAKAASFNIEIGTTNVTGGVLALTSANSTPLGAVVAASAITAANTFTATDTISIEASSVTAFVEGEVVLLITVVSVVP